MKSIAFDVYGTPAPKGSARAMRIGARAILVASSSGANAKAQAAWAKAIREAVPKAYEAFVDVPLGVSITLRMPRPGGHWKARGDLPRPSAPHYPAVYPDVDKLVRCTLDALTGVVFDDDSRIVRLNVLKLYAARGMEGATIHVESLS